MVRADEPPHQQQQQHDNTTDDKDERKRAVSSSATALPTENGQQLPNNNSDTTPMNHNKRPRTETTAAAAAKSTATHRITPRTPRPTITVDSPAIEICEAFFSCMDFNSNGFIEEWESKILSCVAFNKTEEEAEDHWRQMLNDMDYDHDNQISKEEYIEWWTTKHAKDYVIMRPKEGQGDNATTSMPTTTTTKNKNGEDVPHLDLSSAIFIEDYAHYLLECLQRISSVKVAKKMCDTFFDAIDTNRDNYITKDEIYAVSKWAFAAKPDEAKETWEEMLFTMDSNNDNMISREEYSDYWMKNAKNKIQADGTLVPGYKQYLLKKLVKIKNGNRRQAQLQKWKKQYDDTSTNTATSTHTDTNNNNTSTPTNNDNFKNYNGGKTDKDIKFSSLLSTPNRTETASQPISTTTQPEGETHKNERMNNQIAAAAKAAAKTTETNNHRKNPRTSFHEEVKVIKY